MHILKKTLQSGDYFGFKTHSKKKKMTTFAITNDSCTTNLSAENWAAKAVGVVAVLFWINILRLKTSSSKFRMRSEECFSLLQINKSYPLKSYFSLFMVQEADFSVLALLLLLNGFDDEFLCAVLQYASVSISISGLYLLRKVKLRQSKSDEGRTSTSSSRRTW